MASCTHFSKARRTVQNFFYEGKTVVERHCLIHHERRSIDGEVPTLILFARNPTVWYSFALGDPILKSYSNVK